MMLSVIFVALSLVGASAQCKVSTSDRKDCGFDGITEGSCAAKGCCWAPVAEQPGVPWCFFESSPAPSPPPQDDIETPLPACVHDVIRLDAITYTNVGTFNAECQSIRGQPGTVIKGGHIRFFKGVWLYGTLRFQNVTMLGPVGLAGGADVVLIDTHIRGDTLYRQSGSLQVGLNEQAATVSWIGGKFAQEDAEHFDGAAGPSILWGSTATLTDVSVGPGIYIDGSTATFTNVSVGSRIDIIGSTATFTDVSANMAWGASISSSSVSMHGSHIILKGTRCARIGNSTLILDRSSLWCDPAGPKLGPMSFDITDSEVNATCAGGPVIKVGYEIAVHVTKSIMHFNNCSCQQVLPISTDKKTAHPISIKGSSMDFDGCMSAKSVARPEAMLV